MTTTRAVGGNWRRRPLLLRAGRIALAATGGALLFRGDGPLHAPAPPLVHYRMPHGAVPLLVGPSLERAYDETLLLACLQGIVNREAPQLYVLGLSGPEVPDLDAFWWARLIELGWDVARQSPHEAQDLAEVLSLFGHHAAGLVLWDPAVPATSNVAITVAGAADLLPVAYRPDGAGGAPTLYRELVAGGWRPAVSLVGRHGRTLFTGSGRIPGTDLPSSGSAKCDAYLWARAHYLDTGRCDPTSLAYSIDAAWLRNPGAGGDFWNNTLVNADHHVATRAFVFDLNPWADEAPADDPHQPPGTDAHTLEAILASAQRGTRGEAMIAVAGFVPWAFKYTDAAGAGGRHEPVATEWHYAALLSAYNAYMEADALGYAAIANASFTRHLPLAATYPQQAPADEAALIDAGLLASDGTVRPGRYFAFYVGDFDGPAWLYQVGPSLWNDPARGSVPLSWAFDPNLCRRAAPAMAWTRATASVQDSFVAGDSGAGYINPGALEPPRASGLPSGVALWARHCQALYRQWGLQVTGFVIEGDAPAMGPEGLAAYSRFSPGGIVGQKLPPAGLVDGMPLLAMGPDLGGTAHEAAAAVQAMFLPLPGPQFGVARAILQKPGWYRAVADALGREDGGAAGPLHILDLPTLLALVARHQATVPATAAAAPSPGPATLTVTAGRLQPAGLTPVSAADGRWALGQAGGEPAILFEDNPYAPGGPSYLYLEVDRAGPLVITAAQTLVLEVRYLDGPAGLTLAAEYNSTESGAPLAGAYTPTPPVTTGASGTWKTARWALPRALPQRGQNGGADLRLDGSPGLAISAISLSPPPPGVAP